MTSLNARLTTRRIALVPAIPVALLLLALLLPAPSAVGQREVSLNGEWTVWLDPADVGMVDGVADGWVADLTAGRRPASAPSEPVTLAVPGPLEGSPATRGYDGVAFYVRDVQLPGDADGALLWLHFSQVNWACRVWLDGAEVGAHEGGYGAFDVELTGRAGPGTHRLVLRVTDPGVRPVDGVTLKTTPHAKESWYENFGGLLGPVTLHVEPRLRLRDAAVRVNDGAVRLADGALRVDDLASALSVRGTLELSPAHATEQHVAVTISVDGLERLTLQLAPYRGSADFDAFVPLPGAARWSPEHPVLHEVQVSVAEAGGPRTLFTRFIGLRTLELRDGDLLIDGVRRVLKGVLWQPHYTGAGGVTPPAAELVAEAEAIRDTGFNLVRAHVRPAPPAFLDACDRLGLLVLEEPAIGWVDDDPALLPRMLRELDWMVARDAHHPSIILWGVLNELSGKAYRYADALVEHLATLDDSRPILQDSGGFFGEGRVLPPRAATATATGSAPRAAGPATAADLVTMLDKHEYPPYPLALEDRDRLLTLGVTPPAPAPQLVFVSEFGYGTLTDCASALAGFESRGLQGDERVLYQVGAAIERRTARSGATWTEGNWRAAADLNQADAVEEMVEALRANPALDMLCYTQWRAVSSECSAGLLAPWGEDRPARARMRHALRPLMAVVLPAKLSVDADEDLHCALAVVNDTGAEVQGTLTWQATRADGADGAAHVVADLQSFPPGVTTVDVTLRAPLDSCTLTLSAELRLASGDVETSSARRIAVIAAPAAPAAMDAVASEAAPVVWRPGDDVEALASADAVLIERPEALGTELSLDAQLRLWRWVADGGHAVVLLRHPGEAPLGDILGLSKGVEAFTALPLHVEVGSAPGNFMGRLFLRRDAERGSGVDDRAGDRAGDRADELSDTPAPALAPLAAAALGRDDALLSPRAMLVGALPEGAEENMLAVGHLGNRIGAPDASLPFGRGRLRFIGLPLRSAPAAAAPRDTLSADAAHVAPGVPVDARRRQVLAELLENAAARTVAGRAEVTSAAPGAPSAPSAPLTPAQREALEPRLAALSELAALGVRASPWLSGATGPALPEPTVAALALHDRALLALLDSRTDEAVALLDEALDGARWKQGAQPFLALEREVLDGIARRVAAGSLPDWDAAGDASRLWVSAIGAWFSADAAASATAAREIPGLDALRAAQARLAEP